MSDITDAYEASYVIMLNLNRSWIQKQGDFFVESPIAFDELWRDAAEICLDGIALHVASVPHLIALKRISARPQDLADIERLLTLRPPSKAQD